MTNLEFAAALRQVADFYESNPQTKTPHPTLHVFPNSRDEFISCVRQLSKGGTVKKRIDPPTANYPYYHVTRDSRARQPYRE